MRRSPLQRKTPLRTTPNPLPVQREPRTPLHREADPALPKNGPRLRRESPKRAKQMGVYRHLRVLFLASRQWCESPWPCGQRATQVHHRMGRVGWRLTAVEWFAASCTDCNVVKAEQTDTDEAYRTHWKVSPDFAGDPDELPILTVERAS